MHQRTRARMFLSRTMWQKHARTVCLRTGSQIQPPPPFHQTLPPTPNPLQNINHAAFFSHDSLSPFHQFHCFIVLPSFSRLCPGIPPPSPVSLSLFSSPYSLFFGFFLLIRPLNPPHPSIHPAPSLLSQQIDSRCCSNPPPTLLCSLPFLLSTLLRPLQNPSSVIWRPGIILVGI